MHRNFCDIIYSKIIQRLYKFNKVSLLFCFYYHFYYCKIECWQLQINFTASEEDPWMGWNLYGYSTIRPVFVFYFITT